PSGSGAPGAARRARALRRLPGGARRRVPARPDGRRCRRRARRGRPLVRRVPARGPGGRLRRRGARPQARRAPARRRSFSGAPDRFRLPPSLSRRAVRRAGEGARGVTVMRGRGLACVAVAAAALLLATAAAAEHLGRAVLVRPARPDPIAAETLTRLQAELTA